MRTRALPGSAARLLVIVAVVLAGASCQVGRAATHSPAARAGGTLQVVVAVRPRHLDPQRVRTVTEANLSRLISRTLTTYRSASGSGATEVVGDLATDAGRPSDSDTVWDFTLKPGLRWEDGSPLTCDDIKYGVERSYADGPFQVAQQYPRRYLKDNATPYRGPYVGDDNAGRGLESVQCLAADSIRFLLQRPTSEFGEIVASTVFAPVPAGRDTRERYDDKPASSGPYRIDRVESNAVWYARNPYWASSTDPVRHAYPDRIAVTVSSDSEALTKQIVDSDGTWANAALLDQDVAPGLLQQTVGDRALSSRVATGSSDGVRYFAVNTRRWSSADCRKALSLAFDRRAFLDASGGALVGDPATTMIAPKQPGHRDFDVFGALQALDGSPDAAKALLRQRRCPTGITIAFPDRRDVRRAVTTLVDPYQAVGLRVTLRPVDPERYLDVMGSPEGDYDLGYAEWMPDWSSGAAVIPPLFDGRLIPETGGSAAAGGGNRNLSLLDDPATNGAIDAALAEPAAEHRQALWGELDERIQAAAATIPVLYPKAVRIVGENVRGGSVLPRYGQLDVCALGLADPTVLPDGLGAPARVGAPGHPGASGGTGETAGSGGPAGPGAPAGRLF